MQGTVDFVDEKNDIKGTYTFGCIKRQYQDYFKGEIKKGGTLVADVHGTYMGYMDFNKKRYWDARESDNVSKKLTPAKGFILPSDSTNRKDSGFLRKGKDFDSA